MNELRRALLDVSDRGIKDRKEAVVYAQILQAGAKIREISCGILAFVGLITLAPI